MATLARIGDVVRTLGLSADKWRRLADKGKVRCMRDGGWRAFDLDDCKAYVERNIQEYASVDTPGEYDKRKAQRDSIARVRT